MYDLFVLICHCVLQWTLVITNSLGPVKLLCYVEILLYLGCKNNKIQRNFKLWDQENYFVQGCQFSGKSLNSGPGNLFSYHMFQFFCVQIEQFQIVFRPIYVFLLATLFVISGLCYISVLYNESPLYSSWQFQSQSAAQCMGIGLLIWNDLLRLFS